MHLPVRATTPMVAAAILASQLTIASVFVLVAHIGEGPSDTVVGQELARAGADKDNVLFWLADEDIVTNPASSRGLRAVVARVQLVLDSQEIASRIEEHRLRSVLLDRVNAVLSSRTVEQLGAPFWPEIRRDIRASLNRVLGKDAVRGVLIERLVVQ